MVNMGVIKTISVSQSLQPYSPMVFQRRSFLKSHTSPSKSILLSTRIIQQIEPIRTPLNSKINQSELHVKQRGLQLLGTAGKVMNTELRVPAYSEM